MSHGMAALYMLNVFLQTMIIFLDLLVIRAAVKTREVLRNHVFILIVTVMIMDTSAYVIVIIHDVPSFVLDRDFSISGTHYLPILIQCLQWFAQLLFLPLLAIIHFLAIFWPLKFRKLSGNPFWMADFGVLLLGLLLTGIIFNGNPTTSMNIWDIMYAFNSNKGYMHLDDFRNLKMPFFTDYCGYVYLVDGHYWYFDFSKPYTYLYNSVNLILQIFCVTFVVIADSLIVWKVFSLRPSTQQMAVGANGNGRRKVSKETRLAINFLMLSACFLLKTVFFNIDMGYSVWQQLAVKLTTNINLAKWAIYALGNKVISHAIVRAKNSEHTPVTTVAKIVAKP